MKIHPERFADRGCWISDDRVYAFVSSAASGITEIGYHGSQPVSRNSRVLVCADGVCTLAVTTPDGARCPITLADFDWVPGAVHIAGGCALGAVTLDVAASGRSLTLALCADLGGRRALVLTLAKRALFTDVHGERVWAPPQRDAGLLHLRFRDRILLNRWMQRTGPYAVDFMIPEGWRRRIFRRRCRSGLATADDLRSEFRNAPVALYDADVGVSLGGDGWTLDETEHEFCFSAGPPADASGPRLFVIDFGATADRIRRTALRVPADAHRRGALLLERAPRLRLPGYPEIERFFTTVPGIVESCVIADHGIPRATPGSYYWIWAWDAMVTALAALSWGAHDLAHGTAVFVHTHRDDGGLIPMRWTRSLEPLDTQPRGALETLLASLAHSAATDTGDARTLADIFPAMVRHLREVTARMDPRGLFANIGFYPDLPLRFGRTERSAVALEIAAFYTFCRTCETAAVQMGDAATAGRALAAAATVERRFLDLFWDDGRGFLCDALSLDTGERNLSYPLFTLLFLHSPLGLALIRPKLAQCADFIAHHLATASGIRTLPAWDRNSNSETVSASWYPHWDAYALRVLRRAGRSHDILRWMTSVEVLLTRLGYCPEYVRIEQPAAGETDAAPAHGAASNLNCAAGWYGALLAGVLGIETDAGGIAAVPLSLAVPEIRLEGLRAFGSRWEVLVRNSGPYLEELRVDGIPIQGCLKVPARYYDGREHGLELLYGDRPQPMHFSELINAEVLETSSSPAAVSVRIRSRGTTDVAYTAPEPCTLTVDAAPVDAGCGGPRPELPALRLSPGEHTLTLLRGS